MAASRRPRPAVPIANTSESVIDTTTYDDPTGGPGKIATLVVADDETIAIAIAKQGDAFPRVCMLGDITDGWFFGNGTNNPYTHGASLFAGDQTLTFASGAGGSFTIGNAPAGGRQGSAPLLNPAVDVGGVRLNAGSAQPDGAGNLSPGGEAGDFYFSNANPTTPNKRIFICTVAGTTGTVGDPGVAVWVGVA